MLAETVQVVAGVVLVVAAGVSIVMSLVVPRAHVSPAWRVVGRLLGGVVRGAARTRPDYRSQDALLALVGPLTVLGVFVLWLGMFLTGYALILWGVDQVSGAAAAFREAGSSLFTLGIASSHAAGHTVIDYLAAPTGLLVVALEIAYLPTIYAAFNRRETLVTMLESRAGVPAWGPEILARHQLIGIVGTLPAFFSDWEQWAADVAESHTSYPVLVRFRSPKPLRSWVLALLAVLDSAALYMSLFPERAPSEARLCLRMGFSALRDIASTERLAFDEDPLPDSPLELSYDDFLVGVERVVEAGWRPERTPEEAWAHFRGWRVNYEEIAYRLAELTAAVPAPWSGHRHGLRPVALVRPLDRTPDDPDARRNAGGRWKGPAPVGPGDDGRVGEPEARPSNMPGS
ncbi:MAG TPA: hypothetical protein VFH45_10810 [Acidimicrobiales bacterium]|nr:hypothetical protein [Acidimicrobiales bacterium]